MPGAALLAVENGTGSGGAKRLLLRKISAHTATKPTVTRRQEKNVSQAKGEKAGAGR